MPKCEICGRTHTQTGKPVSLSKTGQHAGWCQTCRWYQSKAGIKYRQERGEAVGGKIAPPVTPAQVEYSKRTLNNWLEARRARLNRGRRSWAQPS